MRLSLIENARQQGESLQDASLIPRKRRLIKELGKNGMYLLPNLFTTANLFCGVFAILAIFKKDYLTAATAVAVAAAFDALDGRLARMTKTTSRFGLEYDSLSDLISFGVAPGLLIYAWGLNAYGRLGGAAFFLYVACGALRLARFNVLPAKAETKAFVGLPIPAAAAFIAACVLLDDYALHVGREVRPVVMLGTTYLLAFLMISLFRYRSLQEIRLSHKTSFNTLVAVVLIGMAFVVAPPVIFFGLVLLYILSGIAEQPMIALYRLFFKKDLPLPSPPCFGKMRE